MPIPRGRYLTTFSECLPLPCVDDELQTLGEEQSFTEPHLFPKAEHLNPTPFHAAGLVLQCTLTNGSDSKCPESFEGPRVLRMELAPKVDASLNPSTSSAINYPGSQRTTASEVGS
jgi:hypothetical protein